MIKKLIICMIISASAVIALPAISTHAAFEGTFNEVCSDVSAGTSTVCSSRNEIENPLTGTNGLLLRAARLLSIITGIASVAVIIYGSIKYMLSGGEGAAVESAKNTIFYALIGLLVAAFSQAIIVFVINNIK